MDTAVVRHFLNFFQDFINLCQTENWPDNNTSKSEIKNAFQIAQHVENCLNKLQKRNLLNNFLSNLNNHQDVQNYLIKYCLSDPSKCVLKKIIQSETKIQQLDFAFEVFDTIFSEDKLENCLTDLILETASKQTLLKNLYKIPKQKILEFKSQLFLSELNHCDQPKESFLSMFNDCNQSTVDLIVVSMTNINFQNYTSVCNIVTYLIDITKSKKYSHQKFWKHLFNVEEIYFIDMCLKQSKWFRVVSQALLDCGKLLCEHMSAKYFYIDLTYSELVSNVNKICQNEGLKAEFFDIVKECDADLNFWQNLVQNN